MLNKTGKNKVQVMDRLDFPLIVFRQIDRIMQADNGREYTDRVLKLEGLLYPRWKEDEDYIEAVERMLADGELTLNEVNEKFRLLMVILKEMGMLGEDAITETWELDNDEMVEPAEPQK